MRGLSSWALREEAEHRGYPVSGKQFSRYRAWGVLPELPDGGWSEESVAKLVNIRALGPDLPLHRRIIRLRNLTDFIVPPVQLRNAMLATVPSILRHRPIEKARGIHRAHLVKAPVQTRFAAPAKRAMSIAEANKIPLPTSARPPASLDVWWKALSWPTAADFDLLAGQCYQGAFELAQDANVKESGFLDGVPFEELVIYLLTRQLTIGDRMAGSTD